MAAARQADTSLAAALKYAGAGESVLPLWWTIADGKCACGRGDCKPGKHPLTERGFYDATTDPEVIRAWWARWPRANLGVRTNLRPTVDIDLAVVASALAADASLAHSTRVVSTPHDGLHIVFATSKPTSSRVLYLKDGRRLGELKADEAYVIVPLSKIGRREYKLLSPPDTPLLNADPIEWLAKALPEYGFELDLTRATGKRDYEALAGIIYEGEGRHLALASYAGRVWIEGLGPDTFTAFARHDQSGPVPAAPDRR